MALGLWAPRNIRRIVHRYFVLHRARDLWVSILLELSSPINTESDRFPRRSRLAVLAAQRMRKETGDNRYYAPIERKHITMSQRSQNILKKPFEILFSEPMLIAITLYQSVRLSSHIAHAVCALTYIPSSSLGEIAVLLALHYFILNPGLKLPVLALRRLSDCFLRGTRTVSRVSLLVTPSIKLSQEPWVDWPDIPSHRRKSQTPPTIWCPTDCDPKDWRIYRLLLLHLLLEPSIHAARSCVRPEPGPP